MTQKELKILEKRTSDLRLEIKKTARDRELFMKEMYRKMYINISMGVGIVFFIAYIVLK